MGTEDAVGPPTLTTSVSNLSLRERAVKEAELRRRARASEDRLHEIDKEVEELEAELARLSYRERVKQDLFLFTRDILGFKELYEPLHRPLCRLIGDEEIRRRLILLPRGHFKTTIISIAYPLWCLCRDQNSRVALTSVTSEKAEENLTEIRERATRKEFQLLFGDTIGHPSSWPKSRSDQVRIARHGSTTGASLCAYSVECSEVGRHFDRMVFDDLCDQERVNTQAARDSLWSWFGRQLSVADPGSILTVVGTRWHWDDVYSRIQHLLRAYDADTHRGWYIEKKAVGTKQPPEYGKLLFPTRFDVDELEEIRKVQGDYIFSCFYYNEPTAEGTNPFQLRRFQWIDEYEHDDRAYTYILVDPASTREEWSCYTGIIVGDAVSSREFIVREAILEKMLPDTLIDRIFYLVSQHNPYKIVIEDEGYQRSLYYWLRREQLTRGSHFAIQLVKNPRNLVQTSRLMGLQPFIHGGAIKFCSNMPGKRELLDEFETFPKGPHDDLICALYFATQAVFPPKVVVPQKQDMPHRSRLITELLERRAETANWKGRMPGIQLRR